MNVKNNIKKVAAVAISAAFVASTIVAATAYDLSNYPAPFVEDGMANVAIVVGANAATADVIGAIDIAASLQANAVTKTPVSGSSTTVEGGEEFDEIFVGDTSVTYDSQLDDSDLEGFVDSDFDFTDVDYDYEDYIVIPDDSILFKGSQTDEDYGKDIYAEIATPSQIKYVVEIEADFNTTLLGATNYDDEIELKFLGKTIKITDFDGTDTMTVESSNEYYMEEGDSVTVEGHKVTLVRVGENAVLVDVDGQRKSVGSASGDGAEEFDQADDFEVDVESSFYTEGSEFNSATLRLGSSISETVENGDSAEMFGQPEDEEDADWLWYIAVNNGADAVSKIGLQLNIDRTGNDANEDDERDALMLGDSIELPNNYASIEFSDLKYSDFTEVTVEVDNDFDLREENNGDSLDDGWGLHFTTDSGNDDFIVNGQDTEEVWVIYNLADEYEIWYKDGTDEVNLSTTVSTFTMKLDGESWTFAPSTNLTVTTNFTITTPSVSGYTQETLKLGLSTGQTKDYFGATDEDESTDLFYGNTAIGSADYDGGYFMMNYGAYFENPEDQFGSGNTFSFFTPAEIQEATLVVKAEGSVVSAGSRGMSYSVNPISLGLGVLDTDAPALGSKPMIIVGGPVINTVAAEFLGNPTQEEILATFSEGKALIRYNDDDMAMLVAGWEAMETQGASMVVANFEDYDFSGNELEVVVTDLSDIEVKAMG